MRLFKIVFALAVFVSIFGTIFISCTRIKLEPLVCFQEDVLPILNSHCATAGCHNATDHKEGVILSTYDGVRKLVKPRHPKASELISIINGGEMPPEGYPALTSDEIATLEQWISLGAVNSSNCNTSSCDTSTFTYSGGVKPIMDKYCFGCHNASSSGLAINYSDFTKLQAAALDGSLLGSITHEVGYYEMPKNLPKLSDCQIKVVEKWINAGALNN